MKTNKLIIALGAFTATLLAALAITNGNAFAAVKTWDGSAGDKKFSTATNWSGDSAPVNGDSIVLPLDVLFAGCTDSNSTVTLNNDINIAFGGIALTNQMPSGCYSTLHLDGNDFNLTGDITEPNNVQTTIGFGSNILLSKSIAIQASVNSFGGKKLTIDVGGYTLTVSKYVAVDKLKGSGTITISGDFASLNTGLDPSPEFTGTINIGGTSAFLRTYVSALQFGTGAKIKVNAGGQLSIQSQESGSISVPITLNGTGINADGDVYSALYISTYGSGDPKEITIDTLTLEGDSNFEANTNGAGNKFTVTNYTDNGHTLAVLPGSQGKLILGGVEQASEYKIIEIKEDSAGDYDYSVSEKRKVVVTANWSTHPFTVLSGGILAGTGRIGTVTVKAGGTIAPGLSPGTLTTANIEWVEGGNYEFEIGKDGADKIVANGTVTLGNGTLKVLRYQDYVPKAGASYVIIENDGTDAVNGTFKDLPEGATFKTEDGGVYKISYKGGDGNDVVVTVVTAPKVPNTGFNMLKNNPLATIAITTVSAGLIIVVARRRVAIKG